MLQQGEVLRPSFFVHHLEQEDGQASSIPGVPFPSHLPLPIILFYMRLFLRLIILKITVLGARLWGCKAFLSAKLTWSEALGTQPLRI